MEDNVYTMPSRLDRLATKLRDFMTRDTENRQDWIEIKIGLCTTLAEARDEFRADIEFGRWFDANGFDSINHDTRAAAIAMGRQPEALRACLMATERTSLLTIYRVEFARFINVYKPTGEDSPKPRRRKPAPKLDQAREAVRPFVEAGKEVSREKIAEDLGIGENSVQRAEIYERGRFDGLHEAEEHVKLIEPSEMAPTMAQRYEATVRAAKKQLRIEIEAEVRAEVGKEFEGIYALFHARVEQADKILASHNGIMFRKDYMLILAALHPDHNTFARASEAFDLFKKLESRLVMPDITGPPLPSLAELLRMRKTKS